MRAAGDLRPAYGEYVSTVSTPGMAVSLSTASVLLALCRRSRINTAMDLGSGFTSYALQRWAAEGGADVCSVDDNAEWLARTRCFLELHGFVSPRLYLWPDAPQGGVDLVFHDLASGVTREEAMPLAASWARRYAIFDDAHHRGHRERMRAVCAEGGLTLYSLRSVTLDSRKRYAAMAVRNSGNEDCGDHVGK